MARYSEDEINKLRSRWKKPLLDPHQKIPIEVEGCKTFEELLKKGFNEIRNVMGSAGVWNPQADEKFVSILRALQMYGLEKFLEEGPPGLGHVQSRIVDLRGADCIDAHFEGANCSYAHFEGAICDNTHFEKANCSSAHFEGSFGLGGRYFEEANCYSTHFEGAFFFNAHLGGAKCHHAHFERTSFDIANFKGADCTYAHFEGANFQNAHFGGAKCTLANFEGAGCYNTHFEGADCERAVFRLTNSPGANFEGARLKSADIRDMNVSSDTFFGKPVEQIDAEKAKDRADMWHFAAEANLRIKHCWRGSGYYQRADEYQFREMECRRRAKPRFQRWADWFFYYLIAGYGLKISHPLAAMASIITSYSLFFMACFATKGEIIHLANKYVKMI